MHGETVKFIRSVNILHIFYERTVPIAFAVNIQVICVFYTGIWVWRVCWSDHTSNKTPVRSTALFTGTGMVHFYLWMPFV